jgi:hypothetical protein
MFVRPVLCLLALGLPTAAVQAAPAILCGHTLLHRQQERNASLAPPKPLTSQQLRRSRQRTSLSIAAVRTTPRVGDKTQFWGIDFTEYDGNDRSLKHYRLPATLRVVTANAYIYVDDSATASQRSLTRLAEAFETKIVPREHQYFGKPWTPGIDSDPRVTLLVMNIRSPGAANDPLGLSGVTIGGFFNDEDEYPNDEKLHPYSNEREMVTLNANMDVGSPLVLEVLAHEYQHLIHWAHDRDEALWVNEGFSMVAPGVAGVGGGPLSTLGNAIMAYGLDYDNSLTAWGDRGQEGIISDYGAVGLFFTYLSEKYGGLETFLKIAQRQENGIEGVLEGLKEAGFATPFSELFTRWSVANLVDDASLGEAPHYFGYTSPEVRSIRGSLAALNELLPDLIPRLFQPTARLATFPIEGTGSVRPQAAHYLELSGAGSLDVSFDGRGHPFEVYVLARGAGDQPQFYPIPLDPQTRVGSTKIPGLGSTETMAFLVITNVAEESGEAADYRYTVKQE